MTIIQTNLGDDTKPCMSVLFDGKWYHFHIEEYGNTCFGYVPFKVIGEDGLEVEPKRPRGFFRVGTLLVSMKLSDFNKDGVNDLHISLVGIDYDEDAKVVL